MRICMISKAVVVGAYQRKLEELARLPEVELTVFAPPVWRDSRGESRLQRSYTEGYRLIETPIALSGHFHTYFYRGLERALAAARPELLHVDEEPYNLATWQAMRWAVRHEAPALFFTWQNIPRRYPPPFRWIESYSYRHAAHAIAGSQDAASVLRAKGFGRPISLIPQFGVDPQLFTNTSTRVGPASAEGQPERQAAFIVGYAGGLVPEKGVDSLLQALALCNDQQRRSPTAVGLAAAPCQLALAGSGMQQAALQALSQQLGIDGQVVFLGRLSSTDMPGFYAGIDVLVLPSRTTPTWKEQFGRVLVEAMACGVPVIGSDSGEIPHVIGDAGWIFPEGNVAALAALLTSLRDNKELRQVMGQRGRARVLERYTQQRIAQATYAVYRSLL